jgi:hypothetical protein
MLGGSPKDPPPPLSEELSDELSSAAISADWPATTSSKILKAPLQDPSRAPLPLTGEISSPLPLMRFSRLTNQIDTALKDGTITEDEFNILITKLPAQESLNAEVDEITPKKFEEQAEEERVWLESSDVPIYEAYFTSEFLMNEKKLPPPEYLRDEVSIYSRRRQQLVDFYQEHNPAKIQNIDDLLANYKFKEILFSLQKSYGVAPQV